MNLAEVAINGKGLLNLIIELAIGGLIFYVLWWALGKIAPPDPIGKIVQVILVIALAVWLINILIGLGNGGHGFIDWHGH